jgi:hypothetical protein
MDAKYLENICTDSIYNADVDGLCQLSYLYMIFLTGGLIDVLVTYNVLYE